jgi:hypothetical protein
MTLVLHNQQLDPRRWGHGDWSVESDGEALQRAPLFGRDFFARLFREFPDLQQGLIFLRWSGQPEDVYGVFDRSPSGFVVQIDPALE